MAEKPQWEFHKEFKHDSGVTLRINMLPIRTPVYSFEIGVLKDTGYLNRFFPAGLSWELDFSTIIGDLVRQAEEYISQQMISQSLKNSQSEKNKADAIKTKSDTRKQVKK